MSGYNEFKRVVRNLLLGFLVLLLAFIGLGVGMFFSGRGIVAGIAMSLLWSFPLGYMLVTDRPVQRPRPSDRTLARRRKRLSEYRLPNAEGSWIEESSSRSRRTRSASDDQSRSCFEPGAGAAWVCTSLMS